MVTLDGGVVGLAGYLGNRVGFEGAVGRGRTWREGFGMEFWSGVVAD